MVNLSIIVVVSMRGLGKYSVLTQIILENDFVRRASCTVSEKKKDWFSARARTQRDASRHYGCYAYLLFDIEYATSANTMRCCACISYQLPVYLLDVLCVLCLCSRTASVLCAHHTTALLGAWHRRIAVLYIYCGYAAAVKELRIGA